MKDLNTVIRYKLDAIGEALFWKAMYYRWDTRFGAANELMSQSAEYGYLKAVEIMSNNPLWPQ